MRRVYLSLAAIGFLGAMVGCHTAGVCDCAGPGSPCTTYGGLGAPIVPTQWSPVSAMPEVDLARPMPKTDVKAMDAGKATPAAEKLAPPTEVGK
jgi:hypothetical protein